MPFLDELCDAAGGYCAQFLSVDQHGHAGVALTVRSDPAARTAYECHWGAYDPCGNSATFQRAASGSVLFGDEMIPHAKLRRTAYYADFARPNDPVRCLAGMIEAAPDAFSVASIGRTETHKPFGVEEAELLNAQ